MNFIKLLLATLLPFVAHPGIVAAEDITEVAKAISRADSIAVLSLEPGDTGTRNSDGGCVGHCFHGWPVLGHAVASPAAAKSVTEALATMIATPEPEEVALCFEPRHGVRLQADGHTYDFIICFECEQAEVYRDSASDPIETIHARDDQKSWDGLLTGLGIPLAVPPEQDGG